MVDPDIRDTIETIDRNIAKFEHSVAKLKRAKQILLAEFAATSSPNAHKSPAVINTQHRTRKQQLIDFLLENGPTDRGEIVNRTGMPVGTVSATVGDKKTFRSVDGKWDVTEAVRAG